MTTRPTITIGIMPNTKLLRIERIARIHADVPSLVHDGYMHEEHGAWILWVSANINMTLGTYIKLNDDGTIERVTINPDGTEDVFVIKKEGD